MIGVDRLIEKLNSLISGGSLTELEVTQLSKVVDTLEKKGVSSVLSTIYLPNVVENKGRLFWLQTEQRYVYSNGVRWDIDYLKKYYVNLWSWGDNTSGQLGDNTTSSRSSPGSVVEKITDWVFASSGNSNSFAIRANGTLWAWGNSQYGQLGDGTTTNRSSPVTVVGGFTDWTSAAGGSNHSTAIRANGTIWAWGNNATGQLGANNTISRSSPVSVVGGFTDWTRVTNGHFFSLGMRANGTLWSWGNNNIGQLGDGTTSSRSSPVTVVGGITNWTFVDTHNEHSVGITSSGIAYSWGANTTGKLGDGTTSNRSSPVSVVGGFTDWISISVGNSHSLGLRANGTLWSWGSNYYGQLGTNNTISRSSPVSVVGGYTDWVFVSAGGNFNIALRANGTAWAWGNNFRGELGDGTTTSRRSPVSVIGGFTDWIAADNAGNRTIGLRTA